MFLIDAHSELTVIHCVCKYKPKLAVYGINKDGKLFVHVKIYKGNRIFGEFIAEGGIFKIKCRDCFRWYNIHMHGISSVAIDEVKNSDLTNETPSIAAIVANLRS